MIFRKMTQFIIAAFVVAIVSGCASDYTADAVKTARVYALKNIRGITEEQRHYIRYAQPVIYENLIFPNKVMPFGDPDHIKIVKLSDLPYNPALDKMHSCVVWTVPGMDGQIVVAGSGERSMRFWEPVRALVKTYTPPDMAFEAAHKKAALFTLDALTDSLTKAEVNRVRFRAPEVVYTNFPISIEDIKETEEKTPEDEEEDITKAFDKPGEVKKQKEPVQISLVWPGDDKGKSIVITGFAANGSLWNWKIADAALADNARLNSFTLSDEAVKKLGIPPYVPQMIFPKPPPVDRGNVEVDANDSLFGPSIRMR